jgi:hypothetical protein
MEIMKKKYYLEEVSADGIIFKCTLKMVYESVNWNRVTLDRQQWREFWICNEYSVSIKRQNVLD